MKNSKLKGSIDVIALLIAVGALFYSVFEHTQTIEMQKTQTERAIKLELEKEKPYLQMVFRKSDTEKQKGIVINNVGSGAAKIISFKYFLNEDAFENAESHTSWLDENGYLTFTKDTLLFEEINIFDDGYVLSSGLENEIFFLKQINPTFYNTQARKDMEELIIEIEYVSLNPFDTNTYYLRYCENFKSNNVRNQKSLNEYENNGR